MVLVFRNEFSHVLGPPAFSPLACPCAGSLGERSHRAACPLPPGRASGRAGPLQAPSPHWARSFGVGGGCSPDAEGERVTRGGPGPGGWSGQAHLPGPPGPDEVGRSGAPAPRSPRPPVGGALVMHYSSPRPPPARAAAASLAASRAAAGCAGERGAGAGAGAEPSQYCGSSRVMAQGRRRAALAAGGGRCGGEGSGWGRFWVTRPKGGSDSQGVWFSSGHSL